MRDLWLRIRRAFGAVAPANGLCGWTYRIHETTRVGDRVWDGDVVFRCDKTWGHAGDHYATKVEVAL